MAAPGTADYFPALVSRIRTIAPNLPLEPVVLESVLLCLAAGSKNLILRTEDDDVGFVAKSVTSLLSTVFGLPTHKHKVKCKQLPTAFLQHLFLGISGTHATGSAGSRPSSAKTHSRARPSSGQSTGGARHKSGSYQRASPVLSRDATPLVSAHEWQPSASSDDALGASSLGSSRRLLSPYHAQTSPATLFAGPDNGRPDVSPGTGAAAVPHAIVVSCLESAGVPAQRALMEVLAKRVVELDEEAYEAEGTAVGECGVWSLPPNFIMVYVCAKNATERPGVLTGLLDSFAMCGIVPRQVVPPPLPRSRSRTDATTLFPSPSSKSLQHVLAPDADPIVPPSELRHLRALASPPNPHPAAPWSPSVPHDAPHVRINTQGSLVLYTTDLLSMARHHPELDGTLVSTRAHADAEALLRARRVIHGDSTGAELLREAVEEVNAVLAEAEAAAAAGEAGTMAGSTENEDMLDGGTVHGDWLHVSSARAKGKARAPSVEEEEFAPSIITTSEGDAIEEKDEVWEISDKDVRKIVPKVLLHRLRVRAGPEDQVFGSIVSTAASPSSGQGSGHTEDWPRRSVEDILVDILEDKDIVY